MIAYAEVATSTRPSWQAMFLSMLPAIERQLDLSFHNLPADERAESVQEALANVCVALARLVEQGREGKAFATVLAKYAVAQVRVGRQVGTPMNLHDVTSRYARQRLGLRVGRLDRFDWREGGWRESIVEDHRTPVADQAAFRIDFPEWLARLPVRDRRIAEALAEGHATGQVARQFGVSAPRVSQLRGELHESWLAFHGELAA